MTVSHLLNTPLINNHSLMEKYFCFDTLEVFKWCITLVKRFINHSRGKGNNTETKFKCRVVRYIPIHIINQSILKIFTLYTIYTLQILWNWNTYVAFFFILFIIFSAPSRFFILSYYILCIFSICMHM